MKQSNADHNLLGIDANIGANVKNARESRLLTTEMLGDLLGVTLGQIEKYENGSNRISAALLFDIARILEFPISEFFTNISSKSNSSGTIDD